MATAADNNIEAGDDPHGTTTIPTMKIHIDSRGGGGASTYEGGLPAASTDNPHSTLMCCCARLNTRKHARLLGVVSFAHYVGISVALALSYGTLESAFFNGVAGAIYGLLCIALFHDTAADAARRRAGGRDKRRYLVLTYIGFESLQLARCAFAAASVPLSMLMYQCVDRNRSNVGLEECAADYNVALAVLFAAIGVLVSLKLYFIHVFTAYYRWLSWEEAASRAAAARAKYFIGGGDGGGASGVTTILVPSSAIRVVGGSAQPHFLPPLPTYGQALVMDHTNANNLAAVAASIEKTSPPPA